MKDALFILARGLMVSRGWAWLFFWWWHHGGWDACSDGGAWRTCMYPRASRYQQLTRLVLHRAEIDQATGMLTVQLGVPAGEAFARLRAYAYSQDRRLADVAGDIVARRLRLHRDPGQDGGR